MAPLFPRTAGVERTNQRKRDEIRNTWLDERNQLLTILDSGTDPNPEFTRATVAMIDEAIERLEAQPLTKKPLTSWSRYIGTEMRATIMREHNAEWAMRASNQPVEQPELPAGAYWHEEPTPAPAPAPTPVLEDDFDLGF